MGDAKPFPTLDNSCVVYYISYYVQMQFFTKFGLGGFRQCLAARPASVVRARRLRHHGGAPGSAALRDPSLRARRRQWALPPPTLHWRCVLASLSVPFSLRVGYYIRYKYFIMAIPFLTSRCSLMFATRLFAAWQAFASLI